MVAIVFSAVTAYISREVMIILHKKGEQFTSGLLLRITKFATVKSMSDESVEIQGEWEAIRHVHDLLLRACEEQHQQHPQQLQQCSILDDLHQKKDHPGYPTLPGLGHMQQGRMDHHDPGYPVHPSTSRDYTNTNLFHDVTGGGPLFPMEEPHNNTHNTQKPPEKPHFFDDLSTGPDDEGKIHKCNQCTYTSPKKAFLRDHVKRMHGEVRFQCNLCDAKYRIKKNLNRHVKSAHNTGVGVLFRCDACSYSSQSQKAMDDHKLRSHRYRNHNCSVCHKAFGMKKDLLRHVKIHNNAVCVCTICQKSYSTKWYLKQHMKCHESDYVKPKHVCRTCGKDFASSQILNNHIAAVHQGRRAAFPCKQCGKSFPKKKSLLKHELEHETDRPHKCDQCRKKFRYHTSLARHKLTHNTENEFTCVICNKSFLNEEELKTHSETHLGDGQFECTVCQKMFSQKQALVRHERVHTGERPFECELCGKNFSDSSILRRHKISKHNESQPEDLERSTPIPNPEVTPTPTPTPTTTTTPTTTELPPIMMPNNDKYPPHIQQGPADMSLGSMPVPEQPADPYRLNRMSSALQIPQLVTSLHHDMSLHHSHTQGAPLLSDLGLRLAQVHNVTSQGFGMPHGGMPNPQSHMTHLQNSNLMGTNLQQQYQGYPQCMMSATSSGTGTSTSLTMSHTMKK